MTSLVWTILVTIVLLFVFTNPQYSDRPLETGFSLRGTPVFQESATPAIPAASTGGVAEEKPSSPGIPVHLRIPKIWVDTAVERTGLTPSGEMGTPKNPENTAWYDAGPRPGEEGSAVIDGHYGTWKNGKISAFDHLRELRIGDSVFSEDEQGITTHFIVREIRTYDQNQNSADIFFSSDGKIRLNLITCHGTWNKTAKKYPDRLVVFTTKR